MSKTSQVLGNTADDAGHHYYDQLYYSWCGPGATDVALWYWPNPPNDMDSSDVHDPMDSGQYTSWNGQDSDGTLRLRGYMIYLADEAKPTTWSEDGMITQSYYQSGEWGGATLQVLRDALNWEASGRVSTWSDYFYVTMWNNTFSSETSMEDALHQDIEDDIAISHVPVIVEVPANTLPNWTNGSSVYHFVAIVGYNDTNNKYTYIDTCKAFTDCNLNGYDTPDGHQVDMAQLENGVYSIATNQTKGDGGWVW